MRMFSPLFFLHSIPLFLTTPACGQTMSFLCVGIPGPCALTNKGTALHVLAAACPKAKHWLRSPSSSELLSVHLSPGADWELITDSRWCTSHQHHISVRSIYGHAAQPSVAKDATTFVTPSNSTGVPYRLFTRRFVAAFPFSDRLPLLPAGLVQEAGGD